MTLPDANTPGQSEPWSNENDGVLCISPSSITTGA